MRPHRPNPYDGPRDRAGANKTHRPWLTTHVKQETMRERKVRLNAEAVERQTTWAALTPQQKLTILDGRPGASKRQRARIMATIEKSPNNKKK